MRKLHFCLHLEFEALEDGVVISKLLGMHPAPFLDVGAVILRSPKHA
jgi:hypothetical protein